MTLSVELWGETLTAIFMCRSGRACARFLLHGGVGAVGNYRDELDKGSSSFLTDPDGTDRPFHDFFIQTSHNTVRQLQFRLAASLTPAAHVHTPLARGRLGCVSTDAAEPRPARSLYWGGSSSFQCRGAR